MLRSIIDVRSVLKRRFHHDKNMILYLIITTMAGLLAITLARTKKVQYYGRALLFDLKLNHVGVQGIIEDCIFYWKNKTELPKLTGKVAIVTGGSRGIGVEIVKMLMKCDVEVIIACRRTSAGEKVIQTIRDSGVKTGKAKVMELDNSSLESVKAFVEDFKKNYHKLDILINNAGIMFTPYKETKDGYEEQYGVNYLSHFMLTILLLPLLKNAGTSDHYSRIVNVSSCAHLMGNINFEDINYKKSFLTGEAYAQSKLAQVMFTKSLTKYFQEKKLPITSNAVHPGIVNTDLFEHSLMRFFKVMTAILFKNPVQGATPIVYAAVSPEMEKKSGLYISNCREASINPLAKDETIQDQLFRLSLKQVGLQNVTT